MTAPIPIYKPEPEFTEEARKARYNGTVVVAMIIDPSGHPTQVRIIRGPGMGLERKALEAVTTWRFKPAMRDGKPVSVLARVDVTFRLW